MWFAPFYSNRAGNMASACVAEAAREIALCVAETKTKRFRNTKYIPVKAIVSTYIYEGEMRMKQNGKKPKTSTGSGNSSYGGAALRWCNVVLSDEDATKLDEDAVEISLLAVDLVTLAIAGFDVSLRRTDDGDTCQCTIIGNDPYVTGGRAGMSGWASNYEDAIRAVLYKWFVVCGQEFPPPSQSNAGRRYR